MNRKKAILMGCGGLVAFFLVGTAVVTAFLIHVSKGVEGVGASVESPLDVVVGETFTLTIKVENQRGNDSFMLNDIDINDTYLSGFSVISVDPVPEEDQHVPIDNSQSYSFNVGIPSGESREFKFELRAEREGIFRGDVDICEGMRFKTITAQTVVNAKEK
jgi:hypothetical protein